MVIKDTMMLLRPLSNCACSGFSVGTVRKEHVANQRVCRSCSIGHMNPFDWLHEALELSILKVDWLLCRLGVDGFKRYINFRQKNYMVAR